MKIATLIPIGGVAVLAFLGYQYAANQSTTVRMLVDARTGLGTDPEGIVQLNKNLETEAATVAKRRADALKANQDALVMAQKAREDMEAAQAELERSRVKLEEVQAKIAEAEAQNEQIEKENEKVINAMHSVPLLASASPEEASGLLEEYTKDFETAYEKLQSELSAKEDERTKLMSEVSSLEVDLKKREDANTRFMETYRRNGEEFVVNAVDPRWHFVVFSAAEGHGFFPGAPIDLLLYRDGQSIATLRVVNVNGSQIVAEYDEKALPPGVQIRVGDRIFRQKPLGS